MKRYALLFSVIIAFSIATFAQPDDWKGLEYKGEPWVRNASRPYDISEGLEGRHLSLWASHGRFYDVARQKWRWQRPPLYTTCEDLFTQTIVVPYLIPMLENAGAIVFTPRERDWQRNEVIVDNDTSPLKNYSEQSRSKDWQDAPARGFTFKGGNLQDGENPFEAGTARTTKTTKSQSRQSFVIYRPDIPETGRYAVYVSYQTLPNSISDAHYTVYHQGQKTDFLVNQQMGGSTWVYLGTFPFDAGNSADNCVILSNLSSQNGTVSADAVRFGGGMGNIEREGTVSQLPRCLEGARYWAQWAGMPYNVYSPRGGENDYADDINVRSLMTNELCGGSVYAPDSAGRGVPIELSLAVHSDAGYNKPYGEGIYGSLTICTTMHGDSLLAAGRTRQMSKELASELLDNTVIDLQRKYGRWTIREVYDRNYSETRLPIVPSAILETLSHQNFLDMRYALDPNFRFTLARSIYKTLLRYVARKHNTEYTVTPLAPHNFRIEFTGKEKGEVRICWSPTSDPYEPSSAPTAYLLQIAEGDQDFDNGMIVHGTAVTTRLRRDALVHFRVTAVNDGGISFPSSVLSACYRSQKSPTVIVVDGFRRLSSPAVKANGFDLNEDAGVSFGRTCGTLGHQKGFDISRIGIEDSTGLGYTVNDLEGRFIAGNDFNYVRTHASAIYEAGKYNIVSCSSEVLPTVALYQYDLVDMFTGLEKNDGHSLLPYKAFPQPVSSALSQYVAQGGRLLVSGAYLGSDMNSADEQLFLKNVLKIQQQGVYHGSSETISGLGTTFDIYHQLNEHHYAATHCDVLMPSENGAFSAMLYADGTSAATAYKGSDCRLFVMGFPFECIKGSQRQKSLMKGILNFLLK
ncbi:MAG: xanthan lyase [Prevotella sp.]|nr:xanthan lyase [Prevotella sp.]